MIPSLLHRASGLALLAASLLTAGLSVAAEPAAGPLFAEAEREFAAMKSTFYQARTEVDRETGSYRYDCVGFVSYALRQVAPQAWATVAQATGIAKGRIPSPPRYRTFFAGLTDAPQPGWQAVARVADLRPGDVIAWEHRTATAVGHAVIVASTPTAGPGGWWRVKVYDSTGAPHTDDSRPTDARAQRLPDSNRPSGLGHGVMFFLADPASGALKALRWSERAKEVEVPLAAGRPVS